MAGSTVLNRIKFAFAAGLFLTPPPFAAKPKWSTLLQTRQARFFNSFAAFSPRMLRNKTRASRSRPAASPSPLPAAETPGAELDGAARHGL